MKSVVLFLVIIFCHLAIPSVWADNKDRPNLRHSDEKTTNTVCIYLLAEKSQATEQLPKIIGMNNLKIAKNPIITIDDINTYNRDGSLQLTDEALKHFDYGKDGIKIRTRSEENLNKHLKEGDELIAFKERCVLVINNKPILEGFIYYMRGGSYPIPKHGFVLVCSNQILPNEQDKIYLKFEKGSEKEEALLIEELKKAGKIQKEHTIR